VSRAIERLRTSVLDLKPSLIEDHSLAVRIWDVFGEATLKTIEVLEQLSCDGIIVAINIKNSSTSNLAASKRRTSELREPMTFSKTTVEDILKKSVQALDNSKRSDCKVSSSPSPL